MAMAAASRVAHKPPCGVSCQDWRAGMGYFEEELRVINSSIQSMDMEVFGQAVEECIKTAESGHKIIASGLGKNVPVCEKFVGSLLSLGIDAAFLHTNSAVHGDMGAIKDGDLLFLLTKSGETAESVWLAELLQGRDVRTWLLTFEKESRLSSMIGRKLCLSLEHEGDPWNVMPNNSTTVNLIVLQGIAMEMAKKMGIPLSRFKQNHPGGHIGEILAG